MKRSELAEYIKETIVDVLSEASVEDVKNQETINKLKKDELTLTQKIKDLSEDIDDEDVAAQQATVDTKDSVSVISRKLQATTKEMKSTVNQWKKAEGEEKERLLARLKELTKIKKELEGLL
jgi:uncharacterized protein involved in exopolysaccharide biosynthesis